MYQTILVPTDFSEPSERVWQHAAALAKLCGARLMLLYVAEPVMSHYGVVGLIPSVTELEAQHDIASRLKLKELVDSGKEQGVKVESRVAQGKPWRAIVETAQEIGADLVVMGTHGRTGLSYEAIGSTAERVVQGAPCPVLVVRPKKKS
ncbi:MAG: universal stress protein [Nitrospirota bacterium]|nr:universal stress protein [Nitrospirota bacterium]